MEKRTILAVILSAAVLFVYMAYFGPPADLKKETSSTATSPSQDTKDKTEDPVSSISTKPEEPAAVALEAELPKTPAIKTPLSSPLVKSEFTSHGGFPLSWALEKFYEQADHKGPHTDLIKNKEAMPAIGLVLYSGKAPLYPAYEVLERHADSVRYRAALKNLQLEQKVQLQKSGYGLQVSLKLKNTATVPLSLGPGLRMTLPQKPKANSGGFFAMGQQTNQLTPLYRMGTEVERIKKLEDIGTYTEKTGSISWTGLEDQYFLRALLSRKTSTQNKTAFGQKEGKIFSEFQYAETTLNPGDEKTFEFDLYLGPKNPTYLGQKQFAGLALEEAIDYGWFAVVARPILLVMKFFHSFLGNWGLAIILLTIVIKLIMHPLTRKSMASMKAMQQIQPELKKIREKYKEDKERLNMEMMNLFRKNKVNPMGGCLPMLLQMPIYIALYKVLYTATELYHAPFFWFYRDLSAPDPYYILPILMGVSMLAQQKLTPSTGDSTQAKMMMIMPVMFTVFMLFLPVGLVLYIFVNTIMTVIQQYMHREDITLLGLLRKKTS